MGVRQWWRGFVGNLDTRQTTTVLGAAGLMAAVVGVSTGRRRGVAGGLLLAGVALDLAGGLVAFQLAPTRAAYSRKSLSERMVFVGVHLQPLIVPLVERRGLSRALGRYATAVGATAILEMIDQPDRSRRVTANAFAAAVSAIDLATDRSPQRWLGPVYLMKVVGGHGGIPGPGQLNGTVATIATAATESTT